MKIHQQLPVADQAAAGNVRVAQHHVPTSVLGRVGPDQREHLAVVIQVSVVAVHQFRLSKVDRFAAHVDERSPQEIEPELGFRPTHVRHRLTPSPVILEPSRSDRACRRSGSSASRPAGPRAAKAQSGTGTCSTWVVTISKMQACRIMSGSAAWTWGSCCLARSRLLQQIRLAAPQAETSSDELRSDALEHPDVVFQVAAAVEQALHRNGSRQIVLQHLARDRFVELKCIRPRRDRLFGRMCRLRAEQRVRHAASRGQASSPGCDMDE